MLYALGFIGLFTIGGLTGLFLAALAVDVHRHRHLFRHRPFPLHHGRRHGDGLSGRAALLVAEDHRAHLSGDAGATIAALMIFVGFNLTFFPQFVLGYLGMPRRYHAYPAGVPGAQCAVVQRGRLDPRRSAICCRSSICSGRCATANARRPIPGAPPGWSGRRRRRRRRTTSPHPHRQRTALRL